MSEIKGCMNCGNISCGNNKKRERAGCGRWISPEDKIAELEKSVNNWLKYEKENTELKEKLKNQKADYETYYKSCYNAQKKADKQLTKAKELLKQWLQTSKASGCDNINIVTDTEQFLNSKVEK